MNEGGDMGERVGFLGLGTMGGPMARNVLDAGHDLAVWNRTASRCEALTAAGATACATPAEAAAGAACVITMLWDADAVDTALFGPDGIVEGCAEGAVIVDMSTTTPAHARACAMRLAAHGLRFLDAPVSGARPRAEAGSLAVMVGGDGDTLARVRAILEAMADTVELVGPTGSGQLVKLAGNVVGFETIAAVCEGLALIAAGGVDLETAFGVLSKGTASSQALSVYGPLLLEGRRSWPVTVGVAHKDLRAAIGVGDEAGADLGIARELAARYGTLVDQGGTGDGCHALFDLALAKHRSVRA